MKVAIYPGSFDPISNGHLDIITRAAKLFDKLYVVVSINPKKKYIFSSEERVNLVTKATSSLKNVEVISSSDLVLNVAHKLNAHVLVRGLRNHADFDNEMELFQFNQEINTEVETILLFPSTDNLFLSSSSIKELVMFNQDISKYVPSSIKEEIEFKLKERL